jgi:hypothetical protein
VGVLVEFIVHPRHGTVTDKLNDPAHSSGVSQVAKIGRYGESCAARRPLVPPSSNLVASFRDESGKRVTGRERLLTRLPCLKDQRLRPRWRVRARDRPVQAAELTRRFDGGDAVDGLDGEDEGLKGALAAVNVSRTSFSESNESDSNRRCSAINRCFHE